MDLVIAKKDLERLVSRCQGVADKRSAMPALSNVLLAAEGNTLHVSATDMFLSVSGQVAADVTTAGSIAVPARDLLERIKHMPDGRVQVMTQQGASTVIKAVGSPRRYTLHGIPGSEFPALPKPDAAAATLRLPVELMRTLIHRTHFSISPDETRAHVNSALFEWAGDRVRMVTTDGHRLSKMESTVEGSNATATMLIPMKAIQELRRLCDEARAEKVADSKGADSKAASEEAPKEPFLSISQSGPNAFFEIGDTRFSVKLVDAQFPPYSQVIPRSSERSIRAPRRGLADALDAVRLAASDRTGGVKLSTAQGLLRITSESPESGNAIDEIPVDFNGAEVTIGFNAKYFLDVLGALEAEEEILLGISGELDPATLRPATESSSSDYVAVVMPMRI